MKPLGKRAHVPNANRHPNAAALTGSVVQKETGDALGGAIIALAGIGSPPNPLRPFRYTDSTGGFVFDSLAPGTYRAQVRLIGEHMDTATVQLAAGRVDTLVFRLQAYRCHGY